MADQRLDEQPGDRPRNPEDREIVDRRAQRLEDAADIGALEREPDLDAEKAERDVPQPPEAEQRLDRKSTRLNSKSLMRNSYADFCLQKKNKYLRSTQNSTQYKIQVNRTQYT